MVILGRRRRRGHIRGRHWTLATAPHVWHSCCKMPFSADAAGLAQPTIAAGYRVGAPLTKRACAGVQSQGVRARYPSAQPDPAPVMAAHPAARLPSRLVVVRGQGLVRVLERPHRTPFKLCCCGRRVITHVARIELVRALEISHRTPFKLRLRAQAGEGMRSEGQRRRLPLVDRLSRLRTSTAVYCTEPLSTGIDGRLLCRRSLPSTTVYHRLVLVDGGGRR